MRGRCVGGSDEGRILYILAHREASRGETKCKHAGVGAHVDCVVTLQAVAVERGRGSRKRPGRSA